VGCFHANMFTFRPGAIFQGQPVVGLALEFGMGGDMSILPFPIERRFPMTLSFSTLNILNAQSRSNCGSCPIHNARQP
jgi:hypothetical protein